MMIFCLCLCAGCFGYRGVVKSNWGITLPAGGKEVYEKDSGASFHGDGIRYHALLYDAPEKPAEYLDWKIISGEEKASEELLEKISVPEDGRPDYVNSVIYTDEQGDGSRLFIFYNGSGGEVWILEEFICGGGLGPGLLGGIPCIMVMTRSEWKKRFDFCNMHKSFQFHEKAFPFMTRSKT